MKQRLDPMRSSMTHARLKRLLLLTAYQSPMALRTLLILRPVDRNALRDPGRWEPEYRDGGWDWLWNSREAIHHQVIAAYSKALAGKAAILDVGCGEGVLHDALRCVGYERYTGIDLSATAVARAARSSDERTHFVVADAETFETAERFNLIVLNECLYYLADPPALLARLARFLEPGGAFIISMAMGGLADGLLMLSLWRDLERDFAVREEVSLLQDPGSLRIIKILQPLQRDGYSRTRPPNARITQTDTRHTTTTIDKAQRSHM